MREYNTKKIHLKRLDAQNVLEVCQLIEILPVDQRKVAPDNALSIAQEQCSKNAWMQGFYLDRTPIGFIMLHIG